MRLQLATQQVSPEQHCQFSTYIKSLQNHGLKRIFSGVTGIIVDAH